MKTSLWVLSAVLVLSAVGYLANYQPPKVTVDWVQQPFIVKMDKPNHVVATFIGFDSKGFVRWREVPFDITVKENKMEAPNRGK